METSNKLWLLWSARINRKTEQQKASGLRGLNYVLHTKQERCIMKENNNNDEMKYDSNKDYIMLTLIGELIGVLVFCFFWFFVKMDTENLRGLRISYLVGLIIGTILNLYSGIPRIIKQLKEKKDNWIVYIYLC